MRNYSSESFGSWLWKERFSVTISFATALLPLVVKGALTLLNSARINGFIERYFGEEKIWLFSQCVFILFTILLLYDYRSRIHSDLVNGKAHIIKYINKNCRRKLRGNKDGEENYELVNTSVRQFYMAWIAVWMLWLVYYMGRYLLVFIHADTCSIIFGQAFDFLTSTVMLFIYIILSDITVDFEKRKTEDYRYFWEGMLAWLLIFVVWFVLMILEICRPERSGFVEANSILISVFSAVVFVMVLGKMNSHYLHIPRLFMFVMYVYAVVQAYIPFQSKIDNVQVRETLEFVIPMTTLLGKVFVMLSLCWIVNKKRLIFFLVHRSNAMQVTKDLLAELDQEPVNF